MAPLHIKNRKYKNVILHSVTLPKFQCTAEQYHIFYICGFWCVMAPLTSVYTAVLYSNICCLISDFRSVVNFSYVSSPKFVPNQKDFIILAASVSRFLKLSKFLNLFNISKWRTNQITGTLKTNPKQQLPPSCLFKDNDFWHAFYFMVSVCITF